MHIFNSYKLPTDHNIYIQSHEEHHISLEIKLKSWSNDRVIPLSSEFVPAFELILIYDSEDSERVRSTIIPIDEDGTLQLIHLIGSKRPEASTQFCSQFYLTARNIDLDLLKVLWNTVADTSKVEKVVEALQIIDPEVEGIRFTDEPDSKSYVFLNLNGQSTSVPLGSMGEGMRRILTLAITAVAVENGILLVDEIEMGLHYEAQTDMWRLLIKIAQQLNIQVFATTHSWDCISAFQEALAISEDSSIGKLFRLSRKGENIRTVDYPAEKLGVAVRQNIEVR